MDGNRVASLVDGLTSTYEAAFNFYIRWKQKQEQENHYKRHPGKISPAVGKCSLSASLDMSSHRIESTYQVGFAIIGPEFSVGDAICRDSLWANLTRLHERVNLLRLAILSAHREPLELRELLQISESTRHNCINALAQQYKRLASGRLVPQDLPIPSLRPSLPQAGHLSHHPTQAIASHKPAQPVDFDRQTAIWSTTTSGPPTFQSEPPSPPPTPLPPDTQSLAPSTLNPPGMTPRLRPNNSVFSIFCPEAMALQVDPTRPVPGSRQQRYCRL
ncbi:hypothetical protein NKR19_g10375, partial [Coniochaeta hoffmannii]